jgi:hypothetical protein
VIAAHINRCQRPQNIDHLIRPRAIPHDVAQIPQLIEPSASRTPRYRKDRLQSVQISVDVRYNERAHTHPV